ncbi:SDR family NAD(P)-dependent oxidoreductase [Tolypothrix sp. PCC 7910]|uniref:SDR family NAD(P)-dependent oxidoreductase n=1 Tax=Tolypothrix sp. PCC 7910 TaxID=2099387 RepID=UPI0014277150|nr:SDR family NAD(P)-dependent oxidoreductase [Tolypothrix sp. PCC 7910]QIR39326.1 SDR family NAD(P)-dependent oxidoreductase [Tolypothrix sp. PCC 7910]
MAGKLTDKVAIVTGASSGIGEATALALAAEGAKVVIAARRSDRLLALEARITAIGGKALSITTDVSDEAQVEALVNTTGAKFGRVDILINNAGVMLLGLIDNADTEDWRRMINLNVLGLMYATHKVLPLMKAQGVGHIVNISSVAGRIVNAGSGVYNASKWAVGAFSEALRKEVYQNNIRVTIIEPGLVATELPQHITHPTVREQMKNYYGSVKNLESEDIANAIVYAVTQPSHVNVNEILIRPIEQQA